MIKQKQIEVISSGPPDDTTVVWIDTNEEPNLRKIFVNGQWVPQTRSGGGGGSSIDTIMVNNTPLQPDGNNAVNITVPTKTSDLNNDAGFLTSYTETDPNVPAWAKQQNKPTYSYSEIQNTPTIPDAQIQSDWDQTDTDAKDYIKNKPTIPDTSNFIQTSNTSGLVKNDGTIDTNTYITSAHEVPSGGNAGQVLKKTSGTDYEYGWANSSETLPSAYCTTAAATAAKKANCTLYNLLTNSYVHVLIAIGNSYAGALTLQINGTTAKPIYINGEASSSTNYTLPSGTYIAFYDGTNFYFRTDGKIESPSGLLQGYSDVHPAVATSQPNGGFLPNIVYKLGTITGSVTFTLATPTDNNIANCYHWIFDTSSTAPTITWPSGIVSWQGGSALTINASKTYEVSVMDGLALIVEY